MKKTSSYFTSFFVVLVLASEPAFSQDTIDVALKIKAGIEVSGPVTWFTGKKILNIEGYTSMDLNEKRSLIFAAGYVDYNYSQYNYEYHATGLFARAGMDFNLLSPLKAQGKYWAGIGLRYGISRYTAEAPFFTQENYWGTTSSSIGKRTGWGHFVEVAPGVRAEIFRNLSIGWTVSGRLLLSSGAGRDVRPLYIPGFGNGGKRSSAGMSYFITWNIPYKRITVITRPEPVEEPEEEASGTAAPVTR